MTRPRTTSARRRQEETRHDRHQLDAHDPGLAAEIAGREEWDEPPGLYSVGYAGGKGFVRRMPLPDAVWSSGRTGEVLAAIADGTTQWAGLLRKAVPPGLHGMALFTEQWMASAPHGTPEGDDLLRRARAAGGRVSQLADRVEARAMWAVDRAGITYQAFQVRGSSEVRTSVSYPQPGQGFTGTVPRALDRLVTGLLGVSLPERQKVPW
jgi:hypothetical protein